MSKPSAVMKLANRMARSIIAEQTRARICMSFDGAIIAAHEVFKMGPGRSASFADAYNSAMNWLASLYISDCDENHDDQFVYAKAKRDELILSIVGEENFVPFDKMYGEAYMDELKRIRIMNAPQLPLQLGDTVWFIVEEAKEFGGCYLSEPTKVTGVGYRGFCCSSFVDDPDDMNDFYPWSWLGRDAFANESEAKAALKKRKGV